jgi:hypothetical protein
VALLELLAIAARARVVAAHVLQGVAHGFLVGVAAVRTVDVAMVVMMVMIVMMVVIVVAIGAMDVGLLGHLGLLRNKIGGDYHAIALQVHVVGDE